MFTLCCQLSWLLDSGVAQVGVEKSLVLHIVRVGVMQKRVKLVSGEGRLSLGIL